MNVGYEDDRELTRFDWMLGTACLVLVVVAMIWPLFVDRLFPPYFGFDELRGDSFAAVLLSVYPAGIALMFALFFFRHYLWRGHGLREPLLAVVGLFVFGLIAIGFGVVAAAIVAALLIAVRVGEAAFGKPIPPWFRRLVARTALVVALLGLLAAIVVQKGDAHLLTGVFGISLAAAIGGSLASVFRDKDDDERVGPGEKILGQVWSWPYAPLGAAVVLQLAAVARTWSTGDPIDAGLPGTLLWLSAVVSLLGLLVALRFRVFPQPKHGPGTWWEHSLGFRRLGSGRAPDLPEVLGHYGNWIVFGLGVAALTWGITELWDARTTGADRVPVTLLMLGVALSLLAVITWLGGVEQLLGRLRPFFSYRLTSLWVTLFALLGAGIPLVALFADKADNRVLGPAAEITLTPEGHEGLASTCPDAPQKMRGLVDTDTLDTTVTVIEPAPGYCDGAERISVPSDAIAAVRDLDDIDAQFTVQPIDPRDGPPGRITITSQMPDRLGTRLNTVRLGDGATDRTILAEDLVVPASPEPPIDDVAPARFRVVLEARDPAGPGDCADARYSWTVTHTQTGNSAAPDLGNTGCQADLLLEEGDYDVVATPFGRTTDTAPGRGRIRVEDWLIVALGDSVGSGEGNPPFRDDESGCNRSDDSGQVIAAQRLERRDPTTSVTLLHLSCTGARTVAGNPTKDTNRQAQHARHLLGGRQVDAVLLSVGANDLEFSRVVTHCITWDCERDTISGGLFDRVQPEGGTARTMANLLPALRNRATRNYRRMAKTISTGLSPRLVLATQYFDATRDEDGEFCSRAGAGFVEHEARLAFNEVIRPLNQVVQDSASDADARFGPDVSWQYVGGIADDFAAHGYCASPSSDRWIVGASDSPLRQFEILGAFHPNAPGHRSIATSIYRELGPRLGPVG